MANQKQNPPQQEKSFVAAKQVGFNLKEEVGVNTCRYAIGAHYLPHSSEYVPPPSINVVRQWFLTIGHGEEVSAKRTLRNSLLPPSVNNWELKPNQPEEPPFIDHMLAICAADKLVVFKAPKISSKAESVSQGTKPGAQTRHKKPLTSSKQPFVSSKEETKDGSSKAPTGFKTSHFKKRKESNSAMDLNLSQPPVSTLVDTGMHKKDQQATGGSTSLASFIIHYESTSGCDALVDSTAKANHGLSIPNDSIPQQQDQTKYISKGLETVITQPIIRKGANFIARQVKEEEAFSIIKLEDLENLVSNVEPNFKDLDSPKDDHPQMHKLEAGKNKAEDEAILLKAQPSFPNMEQLNELLVKSLKSKFLKILSTHDFSSSLPTGLKDLPSKFNDLTKETLQWELPAEFLDVPSQVEMVQTKLKTFDALPSLLNKVTNDLNRNLLQTSQGPGFDDQARTFSSLLLAEVDKRNMDPLKQMRTIDQLRRFTRREKDCFMSKGIKQSPWKNVLLKLAHGFALWPSCEDFPAGHPIRYYFHMSTLNCQFLETPLVMRILALEVIFSFPCELRASPRVPSNLDNGNLDLLELLYFLVHDFYRFFFKVQFVIELSFFKRDNQILIRQTLFEIRNMESVENFKVHQVVSRAHIYIGTQGLLKRSPETPPSIIQNPPQSSHSTPNQSYTKPKSSLH
nr:hypothetical protein [Tanacetum cinerariifolium]